MAGKPGMHKKVLNPAAVERLREKIQSERIIKKLENHIFSGEEMSRSQVTAAVALLKKAVPDLSAVEMNANVTTRTLSEELAELNAQSGTGGD